MEVQEEGTGVEEGFVKNQLIANEVIITPE